MSTNQRDIDSQDKLNGIIKSHLNTSLEKGGISVTEDLIDRTLEAIRRAGKDEVIDIGSKHDISTRISRGRYIRTFAGGAAAVLIVFAGIQAYRIMGSRNFKNDSAVPRIGMSASDIQMNDTAGSEKMEESADEYNLTSDTDSITAEGTESENSSDVQFAAKDADRTDDYGITDDERLYSVGQATELTFQDICFLDADQVESIGIVRTGESNSAALTKREVILEFLQSMEQFTFYSSEKTEAMDQYTIELHQSSEGETAGSSYTVRIGSVITVESQGNNETAETLVYEVSNLDKLNSILDSYIQ